MTESPGIDAPLPLPCGAILPNRLCKAALTEGLADSWNRASEDLCTLYRLWSEGGAGLLITGNVQVDRAHLERAGNVVVDGNGGLDALRRMAGAGRVAGNHFWMQINHPGRQTARHLNPTPAAPSPVPTHGHGGFAYGSPRALHEPEILDLVQRFAHVATVARETGFTGIQIHAAHGYLLSQFLSPRSNHRTDDWGGPLVNRARFLLEIVRATRRAVGDDFPISVKLNSADFQRGGLTEDEAATVAQWLSDERLDLLELSGGNHERLSMIGLDVKQSTRHREAYFLDFATRIRPEINVPLMVTGGFRSRAAMDAALATGNTDVIGLGRPLCIEPDLPKRLLDGRSQKAWLAGGQRSDRLLGMDADAAVAALSTSDGSYYYAQIIHMGKSGALRRDLTLSEATREFLRHEQATFEGLKGFPQCDQKSSMTGNP